MKKYTKCKMKFYTGNSVKNALVLVQIPDGFEGDCITSEVLLLSFLKHASTVLVVDKSLLIVHDLSDKKSFAISVDQLINIELLHSTVESFDAEDDYVSLPKFLVDSKKFNK